MGYSTLYCLVPVGHRVGDGIDWLAEKARYRAVVLKRLEKLGIYDIERRIRFEHITTPTDWEHDMQVYRGATFNLAHSLRQMLHMRPRNRFEDLDGVYLVGGGTHPGSGLPVIFESARITTRLMVEDLGLSPHWGPSPWPRPTTNPPSRRRYEPDRPGRRRRQRPWRARRRLHPGRPRPPGDPVREERLARRQGGRAGGAGLPLRHGAHHPDRPAVLRRIFAEAGRDLDQVLDLRRLDPQWRCFFEDGSVLDLTEDTERMAANLDQFSPGNSAGYRDFLA